MTRSYKQLDILERQRIYFLRKQGFSLRKIAAGSVAAFEGVALQS